VRAPAVAALALLTGCASAYRLEVEHVSHPLAGQPFGPRTDEDALTQAHALASWRRGVGYVEAGIGWNLRGEGGGGFYGPALTGTVRAGVEFKGRGHE
jgi:hypothetical protein